MENVKLLTLSELIHGGRALTATSSLNHSQSRSVPQSSSSFSSKPHDGKPQQHPGSTGLDPSPKVLTPLNQPARLIGTLSLPPLTLKCANRNCFQFSDESSTVCCDILDFDVRVIGKGIHVVAWNFIPFKHSGGFLEIIKWKFLDSVGALVRCSALDSFPLLFGSSSADEVSSKSRYRVHGAIESISPLSVVPCSVGVSDRGSNSSGSMNIHGFLVRIMACDCKLCTSKVTVKDLHNLSQDCHTFAKPVIVYIFGSASCWQPVFTKLVCTVVTLSGLKKNLIFTAKEESQLTFVSTGYSVLHLPRLCKKWLPSLGSVIRGKGECSGYTGVVKGVYMHGMLVELDKEVWLLLTDHLLNSPHSIRVGAVISVRNVHFVNPKFSWAKLLVLGACFKTSMTVESFSPLETRCLIRSQSQSLLGKFIDSLSFPARLWALLVISCFQKKFAGILSEKEIVGSKHKDGLAKMYVNSHISSSMLNARHGVFKEFCKHEICDCNNEAYGHNLKLVVPISTFILHAEMIWTNTYHFSGCVSSKWEHNGQLKRRNILSEDINIVLLGQLKISSYTGRVQLLDRTGSIDVMIPHLPSTWNASYIYEVVDYGLAIEGIPNMVDHLRFLDKWISCRSIFHCAPLAKEMRTLITFIHFHFNGETLRNALLYPCLGLKDEFKKLENETFHIFQVTHKYPVLQKFQGNSVVSKNSSMFIEVIVLPWDLSLYGMVTSTHPEKSRMDQSNNVVEHHSNKGYVEHSPCKKRRTVETSCRVFNSGLINNPMGSDNDLSKFYCSRGELFKKHRHGKPLRSYEIPCLASIRSVSNQNLVSSVTFHAKLKKVDCDGNLIVHKVLLELQPENFSKYHCLEIGGNYIMKHLPEDSFCVIKQPDQVKSFKSLCTSTARIWSLHFSFNEHLTMNESKHDPTVRDSSHEAVVGEQAELLFQGPPGSSTKRISDVSLHLSSSTGLLEANLKELEEDLMKPAGKLKESYNFSSSSCTATTMHGMPSGSPNSNSLFCEGNLISLQGDVFDIHELDHCSANLHSNCADPSDVYKLRFVQGLQGSFCVHVVVDYQTVKIFGPLSRHTYVTGFGPGINATFHRILQLGGNKLMLTPVSFIVINSIGVVGDAYSEKCDEWRGAGVDKAPWPASDVYSASASATSGDTVSSCLISDLTLQSMHPKSMRFLCRIAAVNALILEKKGNPDDLLSKTMSKPQSFDILLVAGFTLDDGSGTSCCWADGEKVATLLRLNEELPEGAFENSDWTLKWARTGSNSQGTIMYHFGRLLKKHNRIMVKNYGSMIDSSYQDLTVSVGSENTLSTSDENLLKFVILNACCDNIWTVVASKMDLKAVELFDKKHRLEIDTTTDSMPNLWATEIYHTNPLTEARDMMQELVVHDGMNK